MVDPYILLLAAVVGGGIWLLHISRPRRPPLVIVIDRDVCGNDNSHGSGCGCLLVGGFLALILIEYCLRSSGV